MERKEELKEEIEEVKEELKKEEEEVEELQNRIRELEEKVKKLETIAKNSNIRAAELQREIEYLKERYRKDIEEQRKFGYEALTLDILNVLDNFERALSAAATTKDFDSLLRGVEMIYSELRRILERYNVQEIDIQGKEFDPYLAEAVETVQAQEHPPNTVVKVLQKGYKLHGKVIRPAKVVVSLPEEEIT
ncbi:molecular chaperone GrpE [Hydrogenivirga caldilitoris]|uniref:Protein GrpE n=1 Tax=Hydrogenivirga caldilitoris TaxID=246264 RepID=A0A497XPR5_9AQUI|nr:nucleotide exchange factor GrpE [Hydrogenivirga caldilitoris]RLJ70945.1 molecular chaperone GrpE [Hydrogenivirga caldilitoris]